MKQGQSKFQRQLDQASEVAHEVGKTSDLFLRVIERM